MAGDFKKRITDFHYGKKSALFSAMFFVPSLFYYFFISAKNFLYKCGFLKETKTKPYVICVGNLTTGGVGKTPFVIELANYLAEKGISSAVLSRGYGGKLSSKEVSLVRNKEEILINDVNLTGDEVNLISGKVKKTAVIICKDRVKGANFAFEQAGAKVVITDDGFSNRKIKKDFNIILIDSKKAFGNGFCLPMGPLREPAAELKRADMIVIVNKNNQINPDIEKILKGVSVPIENCKMGAGKIYNIKTGEELKEKDIAAFSGIGQPEQFLALLKELNIKKAMNFDDHFNYDDKTIEKINEMILKTGAKAAVTTEKDAVKILKLKNVENIFALELKAEFDFEKISREISNICG